MEAQHFPQWMPNILRAVMPKCGVEDSRWPDSCNLNWYVDGQHSVGWHADDERLFQGKVHDALIISLSLGQTRKFEVRPIFPEEEDKKLYRVFVDSGDVLCMEGMLQKHYMHRVPKDTKVESGRINLTWRWIVKHNSKCVPRNSGS